jgi:flagellar assembly factor FliW
MSERLESANFGVIDFEGHDVIEIPEGMLGFSRLRRFLLIEGEDLEPFKFLQSVEEPLICFPMIDPCLVQSDFRFELNIEDRDKLGLEKPEQGLVYSVVTFSDKPEASTANLLAPLVINTSNMQGSQIVLLKSSYSVKEPLVKS